jgi:hypothetical protein
MNGKTVELPMSSEVLDALTEEGKKCGLTPEEYLEELVHSAKSRRKTASRPKPPSGE